MKFAVLGAGAVGCYYGGMLARGGHDVTLIARPAHVEAIERSGLRLQTKTFDEPVRLKASTDPAAASDADVVLFSVKSTDTEHAAGLLRDSLQPHALILTLQNGVDNADRLRAVVPHEVAAAVVYVATEMAGPGHVEHKGRGELVIEPSSRADELRATMVAAGIPVDLSDNVRGALFAKLILNCAYNAISAITQLPYGVLVQGEGVTDVLADLVAECLAIAKADGVTVPGDVDASVRRIAETMPGQFSSTAQDVARGKPSEIDHLNGYIVRRGVAQDIPTPVNRAMLMLVKLIESKRAGQGTNR